MLSICVPLVYGRVFNYFTSAEAKALWEAQGRKGWRFFPEARHDVQ